MARASIRNWRGDHNDSDSSSYPSALEIIDGVDNDGDGELPSG